MCIKSEKTAVYCFRLVPTTVVLLLCVCKKIISTMYLWFIFNEICSRSNFSAFRAPIVNFSLQTHLCKLQSSVLKCQSVSHTNCEMNCFNVHDVNIYLNVLFSVTVTTCENKTGATSTVNSLFVHLLSMDSALNKPSRHISTTYDFTTSENDVTRFLA